jgi:predicted Ser/Thr protein kinase
MKSSGRQFADRYELLRLLGRGGMGEVHLARDSKFDRLVALKFFREDPNLPGARTRFLREAATAGRLVHPNIVTVYDYGEQEDELYIAMEYIAGETLARLIDLHQPDSLHDKIADMLGLCAGLAFAHDAGVLHRDIKPANLMVAPSGLLKILDFGIARALDAPGTVTHRFAGSLQYMSPEQITGSPLDARSDVFAVGAVFYELLTFEQAFAADTLEATVERIRFGTPRSIIDIVPAIDPALVAIVDRALQKAPDARFPDVRALERELQAVARRLPSEQLASSVRMVVAPVPAPVPPRSEGDDCAESDPELSPNVIDSTDSWARMQARLLKPAARDYLGVAVAGAVPLAVAWAIGADRDAFVHPSAPVYTSCLTSLGAEPTVEGYISRWNWWPLFAVLPFILFVLSYTARRLFPLQDGTWTEDCGILRKIPRDGRRAVARRLAIAALDRRNLRVAVTLATIIMAIDLGETVVYYGMALRGSTPPCPREFDWTVRFLAGPPVSLAENLFLVVLAYPLQFLQAVFGLMLFGLVYRHNLFYLTHIYQRHRRRRRGSEQIVLDFDDVERCFGLRVLHSTFSYQVLILIVGGFVILLSRFMNVDATGLGAHYAMILSGILSGKPYEQWLSPAAPISVKALFPDAGQVMLALAWMACFLIVAMPSAVKFLPLVHKHVRLVGRRDYLLEFIPLATNLRLDTQEQVDTLAVKFSRSSFWPAGDERARTLYTVAFFVFFMVLVPAPPTATTAFGAHAVGVFVLAYGCMKLTFWLFRKVLVNIDATLG